LPTLDEVQRAEQGLDAVALVDESLARSECIRISGREAVPSAMNSSA